MDLKTLLDTPPWDWPRDAGRMFRKILIDQRAEESDRLVAAELAGDFTVINDDLADALLTIVCSADEPENCAPGRQFPLGQYWNRRTPMDSRIRMTYPLPSARFATSRTRWRSSTSITALPRKYGGEFWKHRCAPPRHGTRMRSRHAYSSGDKEWMLTAVFSMRWVRGFDDQILAALKSDDPEIHYEAVLAAGNWELDAAWSHMVALVNDARTPKPLLLAAIGAVGSIRPRRRGKS